MKGLAFCAEKLNLYPLGSRDTLKACGPWRGQVAIRREQGDGIQRHSVISRTTGRGGMVQSGCWVSGCFISSPKTTLQQGRWVGDGGFWQHTEYYFRG